MTAEIKCDKCGTINLDNLTRCRVCGNPLHEMEGDSQKCPECGFSKTPLGVDKCISCGWTFGAPKVLPVGAAASKPEECEHWSEEPAHTERMAKVDIAGISIFLAGVFGIVHAILAALPGTSDTILSHYGSIIPRGQFLDTVVNNHLLFSALMFAFGVIALALSMSAFKRSSYAGAITGGVFGILAIGFLFGAFFALIGLLLLALSRREFLKECH